MFIFDEPTRDMPAPDTPAVPCLPETPRIDPENFVLLVEYALEGIAAFAGRMVVSDRGRAAAGRSPAAVLNAGTARLTGPAAETAGV